MTREVAAPAGIVLAMMAASVVPAGHPWLAVAATAAFWFALAATIAVIEPSILRTRWSAPVALAYFATFAWNRGAMLIPDYLFNTDSERYLREAAVHRIQVRHLGMPVVTFAREALGREAVLLQCALAGALLVAAFAALAARLGARGGARTAMTIVFGSSLATWTMASVVESFAFSALLLALALLALARWVERPDAAGATRLGLLVLAAAGISLENAYVPAALAAGALAAGTVTGRAGLRGGFVAAAVPAIGLAVWIPLAASAQGPGFYATWGDQRFPAPATDVVQNLTHFSAEYVAPGRLASPRSHVETAWRVFVMSVRGLPGDDPSRYPVVLSRATFVDPGNLACVALTVILGALAAPPLLRRRRRELPARRTLLAACAAVLVLRHLFLVVFAPTQSFLFALPSLLAVDLLLATGLALRAAESPRAGRAGMAAAGGLAALLALTNAWVLASAQRAAPAAAAKATVSPTASRWSRPAGRRASQAARNRSAGSSSGSSVS